MGAQKILAFRRFISSDKFLVNSCTNILFRLKFNPIRSFSRKFQTTDITMVWPTEHETSELVSSILEKMDDVPAGQKKARESSTNIEYVSNLMMSSRRSAHLM